MADFDINALFSDYSPQYVEPWEPAPYSPDREGGRGPVHADGGVRPGLRDGQDAGE